MKRIVVGVLVSLMLAACEKEILSSDKYNPGRAEALKNKESWSAKVSTITYSRILLDSERVKMLTISLSRFDEHDLLVESLGFVRVPRAIGDYQVLGLRDYKGSALTVESLHARMDDDVLVEEHYPILVGNSPNVLRITKLDTVQRYIEGEFEVAYSRGQYAINPYYRDTTRILEFRKGRFQSPIMDLK